MPKMIERLKAQGMTEVSEGALVIPVANAETPDAPPLILIKSGGGYLYHTSDLATVEYRVEHFGADLILYVVDKRQSLHFKQVFEAAKKTGLSKNAVMIHTAFGTMNGKDGKPFKTRDGGTIKLKEIINLVETEARKRLTELGVSQTYSPEELDRIAHQVGIATLKYADLKNNRSADYIFDLERFSQFEGNTGPYLQYAAVRIGSMLKKASEQKLAGGPVLPPTCAAEKNLHLEFFKFADAFWRTYELSEPHHLCDYGFALAQAFNSFYKECHILSSTDSAQQSSWLTLVAMTRAQLLKIMDLLAIDVPERM
jgi:arginyl-tRNA synthetase